MRHTAYMMTSALVAFLTILSGCDEVYNNVYEVFEIKHKKLQINDEAMYVDGFLQQGTPVFQGNGEEPADRLVIPITNGFGQRVTFRFIDNESETGIRIEDATLSLADQGSRQMLYFNITGTPKVKGNGSEPYDIPVSYNILDENGNDLFETIKKTVTIWTNGSRPSRDEIATEEHPFVFLGAEINWMNQQQNPPVLWYHKAPIPNSSFSLSGIAYGMVLNLHYNSILTLDNAVGPLSVAREGSGVRINTLLAPTAANLAAHPEWFTLADGTLSTVWDEDDYFQHGHNSKPIKKGYYNADAPLVVSGASSSKPIQSLSWNMTPKNDNTPWGTFINKPGKYKLYIQYENRDAANDIMQYFPAHPGTGEAGWVPVTFEVNENPLVPFAFAPNETERPGVGDHANHRVIAIRAELLDAGLRPLTLRQGVTIGPGNRMRLWFIELKETSIGKNYKLKQTTGYTNGFFQTEVSTTGGEGSRVAGGNASKAYTEAVFNFENEADAALYNVYYVMYNMDQNTKINNPPGTYTVKGYIDGSAGNGAGNEKLPYNDLSFPLKLTVVAN